ncbi:RDD family protein [Flavobacteriaceae bacterium M23B6Z8]
MDKFQIETSQNVGIHQNVASIVDRMLAFLLDTTVIVLYYILVFWILVSLDLNMSDSWALFLLASLPGFLYYLLMETFTDGKTLGKYALQTRVVKLDGSKPAFSNYFLRWILRIVEVSLTSGGGAVLSILLSGKGQRLGDMAAGTTVISEKHTVRLSDTLHEEVPLQYQPGYPQVTVFTDLEMQEIKSMFEDAKRHNQHIVILRLSDQIERVLEVKAKEKPLEFVQKVILDYNYYTQNM